ncbi:hypothetical protein QBZ16_000442 [Prototheca wickerhamii]|uniref:RNA helicase n=1 Tax=Prototheca wickerhamii TaxID=3111 RepID=A0AAD9ILK2_PROWI|nr:hypothetical protein QBZ16_000442 [Prototheca wickerhamii]
MSFADLGLDPRLLRALHNGHDVVARAHTGSGKTLAYLLPALHRILSAPAMAAWQAVVLVPTRELCSQVQAEGARLAAASGESALRVTALAGDGLPRSAVAHAGHLVVATPAKLAQALNTGALPAATLGERLLTLVLDEADLLLAYGYEDDIRAIAPHVPRSCQCLLLSATTSEELVLHNPREVDVLRAGPGAGALGGGVAERVAHYRLELRAAAVALFDDTLERLVVTMALLRYGLVDKRVLIFVNSVESAFKLRLFLEAFGIRAAMAHGEQPLNSRYHTLQQFNAGLYDYLIATDDVHAGDRKRRRGGEEEGEGAAPEAEAGKGKKKGKRGRNDEEFGVTRGIDFKGVRTVINFEMPLGERGYVHRLGRTGRAGEAGVGISLIGAQDKALAARIERVLSGKPVEEEKVEEEEEKSVAAEPAASGEEAGEGAEKVDVTEEAEEAEKVDASDATEATEAAEAAEAAPSAQPTSAQAPGAATPAPAQPPPAPTTFEFFKEYEALTKPALDALRYRASDVARSITRAFSAFFEEHPNDFRLLKHDRALTSTKAVSAAHLKHLPAYLRDPSLGGKSFVGNAGKGSLPAKKKRKLAKKLDPIKNIAFMQSNAPTDIELKAEAKGRKERRKRERKEAQIVPKQNVRKNKPRKR